MTKEEELLERLAAIEHEQWREWSEQIATKERISEERLIRWRGLWVSYWTLSEDSKEQDRVWARKVLHLLSDFHAKMYGVQEADVVEVSWYDAWYDERIPSRELSVLRDPEPRLSWGEVLGWTDRYLRIIHTRSIDVADGNHILMIPWGTIDKITVLEPKINPQNGGERKSPSGGKA